MATFTGNAAGYRVDVIDGKIRVVDIDASDGTEKTKTLAVDQKLSFADRDYQLAVSTDVLVNTTTENSQYMPVIATLADGGYVIAWQGYGPGDNNGGIFLQRYDAAGKPVGGETRVNSMAEGTQREIAITGLADGGFVMTWETRDGYWGNSYGIFARRFDAAGDPTGPETRINTTTDDQYQPSVTALTDGGYVLSWTSDPGSEDPETYLQRFDAAGNTVGGEFRIPSEPGVSESSAVVSALTDGGYFVTWYSSGEGAAFNRGIYTQRFDAAGNTVGDQVLVGHGFYHDVAVLEGGGHVVTWYSYGNNYGDVFFQRFNTAGETIGAKTLVSNVNGHQDSPQIAALTGGGYVITWKAGDGNSWGVYAQSYDKRGNKVGAEVLVNTTTNEDQDEADVTALADGGFVVTWTSAGQDAPYSDGIYKRYFGADGKPIFGELELGGTDDADVMNGGSGTQKMHGWQGDDTLDGGAGGDTLYGDVGNDTLNGGAGVDNLYGGGGDDTLNGGDGNDYMVGYAGDDLMSGGAGGDYIYGSGGRDTLAGGDGNDTLSGASGNDRLDGQFGDDNLYGSYGNDVLIGGGGDDRLYGQEGNDLLSGGSGNDVLSDEIGNNTLRGGSGIDVLTGGVGSDMLDGGEGDDILDGGIGADTLTGDAGRDAFRFYKALANGNVNQITDFSSAEGDEIQLSEDVFDALTAGAGNSLAARNFAANATGTAQDVDDYILYDTGTGRLYYDADGNGAGARIQFAVLGTDTHPALTAADFAVV